MRDLIIAFLTVVNPLKERGMLYMSNKNNRKKLYLPYVCLIMLMIFCVFPSHSFAAGGVSLNVGAVLAQPGSEVDVPINIGVNPGIASLKFTVKYDKTYLTLTNVAFPKNTGTYSSVPEPYSAAQVINFVSPLASFNKTGLFATLTFAVSENVDSDRTEDISIEFSEDDNFDMDFNDVPLSVSKGSIRISTGNAENITKLPASLVRIENEAFMNTPFSYVELPETVTTIGSKAFANCSILSYIFIPESTRSIASDAFLNDANLVILGKAGSYAETFANNNGFVFQTK